MDARAQQILLRFMLGLLLTEIPIVTAVLNQPVPDWRLLGIGLLGGLGAALEKYLAPVILTNGEAQPVVAMPLHAVPEVQVTSSVNAARWWSKAVTQSLSQPIPEGSPRIPGTP